MLRQILHFLFPSPCLSCGFLGEVLCAECFGQLRFEPHRRITDKLPVVSALYYEEKDVLFGQLIHAFKYKHQADLAHHFLPYLLSSFRLFFDPKEVLLIPVPLHKSRLLERGYNQAELLARLLAKWTGAKVFYGLVRKRDTGHQAHVHQRGERLQNMQNAFALKEPLPHHSHIVLIDDIVTSGATLQACAQALQSMHPLSIQALTLADRDFRPLHPWD